MSESNEEESDLIEINVKSKRLNTINECLISQTSDNQNSIDKKTLMNLISIKDKSITYKTIESKQQYFKAFKRILINEKESEFIKCENCLNITIIKCTPKTGYSSVMRHKCNNEKKIENQTIDKHLIKPIIIDQKIESNLADAIAL